MDKSYKEIEKEKVRNEALKFGITTLTKNRFKSTIARKTYVRDVYKYLQTKGSELDKEVSSLLCEDEITRWESFYESIIRKKKPCELRVAYLSGPNPENDIEVLVKNGILPENIWAFESNNNIYNNAVISALDSKFPFVKIYKGRIENYLKLLSFKFDIIYLDFCGTIASDKTMSVIRDIFYHQKLETLGVLITNFSLPNKENKANHEQRKNLNLLSANYLYPKPFTENLTNMGGGYRESAECYGINQDKFLEIARKNEKTFYSQFITRILYDLPSVLIPYQRLANNNSINKLFFKNFNESSFKEDYLENLACYPNENALVWGLSDLLRQTNYCPNEETSDLDNTLSKADSFSNFLNSFKNQLELDGKDKGKGDNFLTNIKLARYFIQAKSQKNIHSDALEKIRENWKFTDIYVFCDVFMFHQLKEILIGQLTSPYYYNVDYTRRWTYKAKDTEMFMDLITYDECRYIFDWMPTIDMFKEGVKDWNRQLSLRFAMDSVFKQSRWYNDEFFFGTAVVSYDTKTFEAKKIRKRKNIKK